MADVGIKLSATDNTKAAFDSVGRNLSNIQTASASVAGALAGIGVGISVGGFVAMTKQIIDGLDAMNDLKDATGSSIENISALENVALRTGSSFETVSTSLIKFNKALSSAKPGSDAERAITAIGLSVKNLKELDPAVALQQVAVGLAGYADDANKARLVQELFGKSLKEVAPFLKDLAESGQLVATVTTAQAEEAEKLNKQLFTMQANSLELKRAFVNELIPSLGALAAEMLAAKKTSIGFWDGFITQGLQNPFKSVAENAASVRTELAGLEADKARFQKGGNDTSSIDTSIATLKRRLEYFKEVQLQTMQYSKSDQSNAESARLGLRLKTVGDVTGGKPNTEPRTPKEKGNEFRGEQEAAKEWAKALEAAGKASADLVAKNQDLSKSQADLKTYMESAAAAINEKTNPAMNAMVKAAYEANIALEAMGKLADVIEAQQKRTANAEDETQKERDRVAAIGLTTEAVAELGAARLEEMAIAKERSLLAAKEIDLSGELAESIRGEVKTLRERAGLLRTGAAKETAIEAAKAEADERKRGWEETDRIARDVFTSWAEDGSSAAKKIGDTLRKALLSAIYEATLKPIAFQLYTSIAGGGGGSTALQAASSAGGAGNALSGVSSLFSAGGAIANGISNVGAAMINGPFSSLVGDLGASLVSNSAAIASAVPYVGAALIAIKALTDYKIEAKGNGITATIGGASGLPSGSVGQFREFAQTSSGVLSGGNTINRDWSVADQGVATYIAKNVQAITASNKAYADALGLTSGSIDAFTKNIEVNLTGLDAAGQQAAINAELAKFSGEQITAAYGDALKGVAKEGETTAQTLQRLGTDLTGVNAMFGDLGYTLYDVSVAGASAASTLATAFGGLAQAQGQLGNFYQNFYTKAEQEANAYRQVQADLDKAGLQVTVDQLRAASRDDIRAVVDQLAGNTGTADGAAQYAAAVKAANALAGVKPATPDATTAAKSFVDASLAALKNSVSAEKVSINAAYQSQADALNAQINTVGFGVDKLTTFADSLKGALSAMQITGDAGGARAVAQAQISDALMAARSGAALPTDGRLDGALSAVAQPSEQLFGSFEAYAQDFYKTANDIAGLNDLAEQQLTDAELMQQTLKDQLFAAKKYNDEQVLQLDALLVNAQAQLDATNGVNASVLSVADALRAFQDATRPGASVASRNPGPGRTQAEEEILQQSLRDNVLRNKQSDYSFDQIRDYVVATYDGSAASLQAIYAAAKVTRTTVADIAASLGVNAAYLTPYFREAGIPEFAVGTNYIPYDGYKAILHEGEAVVPKAYNPAAGGMAGSMDGGKTAAEVSMLRQDMRDSQAQIAVLMQRLVRINEKWDGEGQPEVRTVAA